MSNLALLLDSFDVPFEPQAPAPDPAVLAEEDEAREAERLAAYENGYRSGWDDCLAAERETTARISAELARNLSDLGFTYHEARTQLLAETEAFLEELFRTVLPRTVGTAVARMMTDDLLEMMSASLDVPVELVVAPADTAAVAGLLGDTSAMPVTIVEEPSLAEGQAHLRFGTTERAYDLSDLSARLLDALASRATGQPMGVRDVG